MFLVLCIIFIGLYLLNNYLFNDEEGKEFNKIHGPKTTPLLGNSITFASKANGPVPLFYLMRMLANRYKNLCRTWELNKKHFIIYNPQDVGVILNNQKHIKKNRIYRFLRPWLNDGLLTSTGDKWQQRRKLLTPAFHFNILRQFCTIFDEQSSVLIENLKKTNGESVEILPHITNFTLNSICETSMGTNLDSTKDVVQNYKKAIYDMGKYFVYRAIRFWLYSDFLFNLSSVGIKQNKILKRLHDFTTNVIRERRNEKVLSGNKFIADEMTEENTKGFKKRLAMLDLLLSAESEGVIDEKGIREEVDTFMFEGHDTTTMGITFCLMLLANHPEVQQLAYEEICSILDDPSKKVSINDLNNMNYLERCIKEALRLYPSVHFIGRDIDEDLDMGSYTIPAGTSVDIYIFDIHRDPKFFPNPLKFDPDRFLPDNCAKRHPYAYIPFSAGPRNCIGQRFAILQEKAVISSILKNFKLEAITRPNDICFTLDLVLRPKEQIKIKFIPRV